MTVGGLSIFLSYASQYAKPFNEISGVITEMQNALACAGRVFELIEENLRFRMLMMQSRSKTPAAMLFLTMWLFPMFLNVL